MTDETPTRDALARALREHGAPIGIDGLPADEFECCADAILASDVLDRVRAEQREKDAQIAEAQLPVGTPKAMMNTTAAAIRAETGDTR